MVFWGQNILNDSREGKGRSRRNYVASQKSSVCCALGSQGHSLSFLFFIKKGDISRYFKASLSSFSGTFFLHLLNCGFKFFLTYFYVLDLQVNCLS